MSDRPSRLEKLVDKTVLPEPGGDFNFTLVITNTSVEPVMITQLVDTNLPTNSFPEYLGKWLAVGESISIPYTVNHTDAMTYGNWAEVWVEDDEGTPVIDRAEQSVEVLDEPPTVTLDKSVDVKSMDEPGGTFNFKLTITNTSVEPVEIIDLVDSQYPEALGYVGEWLEPGEVLVIPYPIDHALPGTYDNDASITVRDNEVGTASASDSESVVVNDLKPTVDLTKSATPTELAEPGGVFTFTLTMKNTSTEPVTITSLSRQLPAVRRGIGVDR